MRMADVREIPVAAEGAAVAGGGGSAWRRVASIARNTFREAVRDRVLYNLVIFVLVLTGAARRRSS